MEKVKCPQCGFVNPSGKEACLKCRTPLARIRIEAQAPPAAAAPGAASDQLRRAQVVANRYTVLNLVGRGGMGCIYKVHDNTLGEEVALKTLLPQFVQDRMVVERFFNEARIARRLAHPNIVRVHDIGLADKTLYISMEFVSGRSLRDILEKLPPNQRLPIPEALRILEDLCAALAYAHQHTIHRDIKPENVMVQPDGVVKLMDFGISKLMDNNRLTGASIVMGTPYYMSPEQLRNSRDVDARADIYSIGVMLYEILTGNMPTGVPKPASEMIKEVPPALDRIIARCVDPDPDNRYSTADELRGALREVRNHLASGGTLTQRPRRAPGGGALLGRQALGAAAVLALVAAMAYGLSIAERQRQAALAAAPPAPLAPSNGFPMVGFEAYAALWPRLLEAAGPRAAGDAEAWVEAARESWRAAESAVGEARTLHARHAAQCLAAVLIANQAGDMAFVPPGTVYVRGDAVALGPYFIDRHEVRIGDFARFCAEVPGGWRMPAGLRGYEQSHADYPAVFVTHYDATAYAAWRGMRLPTEAQWLRAASPEDGVPLAYPWGDEWIDDAARVADPASGPAPVGTHPEDASPWGCLDMAGNVSEWIRDEVEAPWFGGYAPVRGGSFLSDATPLSARRAAPFDAAAEGDIGFRRVLEPPSDPATLSMLLGALR